MCEILKTASRPALGAVWPTLYRLLAVCDTDSVSRGALVAKYRVKLAGRLALLRLSDPHAEEEVPEEVEVILQEMLEALQDKASFPSRPPTTSANLACCSRQDTIVRWSASKYIARITEGLPEAFALEMSEAILSSFESNFAELDTSENALQGACFAFGELARRGRIPHLLVDRLLSCVLQVRACAPSKLLLLNLALSLSLITHRLSCLIGNVESNRSDPAFAMQQPTFFGPSRELFDQLKSRRTPPNSLLGSSQSPFSTATFTFDELRVPRFRRASVGGYGQSSWSSVRDEGKLTCPLASPCRASFRMGSTY